MTEMLDFDAGRQRAARRRALGVISDFDPSRLALARRLAGQRRTVLAQAAGVTPAAITQYEKGQSRPTLPVVEAMADALGVVPDFFRAGHPVAALDTSGAHFRSLRSTSALERDKALAFAELVLAVLEAVERYVELPPVALPDLAVSPELRLAEVAELARQARTALGVGAGPVSHVVRLLESHGVVVVQLDDATRRVDAFSHQQGTRPLVLLNPHKGDKARSRFDTAHELGHLLMHHDTEPGSRVVEEQAHAFAAEFLAPADQLTDELPRRLDWTMLHALKKRWGLSLKALLVRGHHLDVFGESTYKRGLRQLSSWGLPEPGPLGPPEGPVLLPRAVALLDEDEDAIGRIAAETGLPAATVMRVLDAAGSETERPVLSLRG